MPIQLNNLTINGQVNGSVPFASTLDLVAYFDLASNFSDSISGGVTVSQNTAFTPIFSTDSPFPSSSGSWQLNGAEGIGNPSLGPFSGPGSYSAGIWMKVSSYPATSETFFQQRSSQNNGEYMFFLQSNGTLGYIDYPGGTGGAAINSTGIVPLNTWNLVGISRSSSGPISFIINGVISNTVGITSVNNVQANNGLSIGYDQRNNTSFFTGNLRSAFFYNRLLTSADWSAIYANRLPLV